MRIISYKFYKDFASQVFFFHCIVQLIDLVEPTVYKKIVVILFKYYTGEVK